MQILTIAKQRYLLVFDVVGPVPSCAMHLLAREAINAFDIRPFGLVELADSAYQEITLDFIFRSGLCLFTAFCCRNTSPPLHSIVIPCRILNGRVKPNVRIDLELLRYLDEVCQDFLLARVLASPITVLRKAVAIQSRPHIATTPGILVVVPIVDKLW